MPVQMIPLSALRPYRNNPRRATDPEYIKELAQSLKEQGQRDAILVRPGPEGTYEVVAGGCRWAAAKSLRWKEIRAEVREMADEEADFEALDSNLKRKALDELEEAQGLHLMMTAHGWSQAKVAERFGKTQQWVSLRLRLLNLTPEVQQAVTNRFVSPTAATHIAQAPAEMQAAIVTKVEKADLSVRETERLVKVVTDPSTPADVKQAVLTRKNVTPAHAEVIAQASSPTVREGLIAAAAKGQITPEETAKEVQAAIKREEAPPSVPGEQAERRLDVFQPLRKAQEALEGISAQDIADLDAEALADLEPYLRNLGARLNRLGQWMAAAQQRRQNKSSGPAKVLNFGTR